MYARDTQNGFIALTSTIIISAVLFVLVISLASSGFYGRFVIFDGEVKEVSRALAEGCVENAILKHSADHLYTGDGDLVTVDIDKGWTCTIISVGGPASSLEVRTQAEFQGSYTNLEVEVDANDDYSVNSWKEVAEF